MANIFYYINKDALYFHPRIMYPKA